jgi:hypothetical protein
VAWAVVCLAGTAFGQLVVVAADPAEIVGVITGVDGTTLLPGVLVRCVDRSGRESGAALSGSDGRYRLSGLRAGVFTLTASLDGFDAFSEEVQLKNGQRLERRIDLQLAKVTESMDVVAVAGEMKARMATTLGPREHLGQAELEQLPLQDANLGALLAFMPGVVRGRDGVSIRGGFPSQSTVQLGSITVTEPSLGGQDLDFPTDAVATVDVLPNPFAVEFGRFASGVSVVHTRPGGRVWKAMFQDFDPTLRRRRGQFGLAGIEAVAPRLFVGGPLLTEKIFIAQSLGGRYYSRDVMSLPQTERSNYWALSSFTRVDAALGAGRSLVLTAGAFPQRIDAFNLDTFNPPGVAADRRQEVYTGGATLLIPTRSGIAFESTLQVGRYRAAIDGHSSDASEMVVTPEENRGTYYNTQERRSRSWQWTTFVTASRSSAWGDHLLKAGLDVLATDFQASSTGRPVRVLREDGTLAQAIHFSGSGDQRAVSTDVAIFLQDRWQAGSRVVLETGVRVDRDGALQATNVSPRVGAVVALKDNGRMTLQGGIGLFVERTPPAAPAFGSTQSRTVTRFGTDGVTPLSAVLYTPRLASDLSTARSRTWNVEFEDRVTPSMTVRAGWLQREGSKGLTVAPAVSATDSASGSLWLSSTGESRYREASVSFLYAPRADRELDVSYVRSVTRANLNAYSVLYGVLTDPFVRADQYGPTGSDAPNRLVARAFVGFKNRFRVFGGLELRSGLPFTPVDDQQDYVGARNVGHYFPTVRRVDLACEARFSLLGWHPWIGVRLYNAFNIFLPADVQANLASPGFGGFSNQATRLIRFTIRLEK